MAYISNDPELLELLGISPEVKKELDEVNAEHQKKEKKKKTKDDWDRAMKGIQ